jgi:ATP synthase protein I
VSAGEAGSGGQLPEEEARLDARLAQQAARAHRARSDRRTLFGNAAYLGTLGILFVVPVLGGAYLGRWCDERLQGFSFHWTVSLILLGVGVGAVNVYLFLRD